MGYAETIFWPQATVPHCVVTCYALTDSGVLICKPYCQQVSRHVAVAP
jgi:hypothetical protein